MRNYFTLLPLAFQSFLSFNTTTTTSMVHSHFPADPEWKVLLQDQLVKQPVNFFQLATVAEASVPHVRTLTLKGFLGETRYVVWSSFEQKHDTCILNPQLTIINTFTATQKRAKYLKNRAIHLHGRMCSSSLVTPSKRSSKTWRFPIRWKQYSGSHLRERNGGFAVTPL